MDEIYTISISLAVIVGLFILINIIRILGYIALIFAVIVVATILIRVYVPMPDWVTNINMPDWVKNIKMPTIPPISEWFKKKTPPPSDPLTTDTLMPDSNASTSNDDPKGSIPSDSTPSSVYMNSVDIAPPPLSAPVTSALDMYKGNEVFHVQGQFDYSMARAVCKSYGAQLATYDEIKKSHDHGAEWCEYGWSDDSMVLYPTQYKSWEKYKESDEPQRCGIPGVNGGYNNDTSQQLGANCYGKKPKGKITPFSYPKVKPRPTPEYSVSPFNYTSWSGI